MTRDRMVRKAASRQKRAMRIRRRLRSEGSAPRLCVVKSNAHIEAQIIDDDQGLTVAGISTRSKEFRGTEFARKSKDAAVKLGARIAEMAKEKGIERVVFDRGHSAYQGVMAALADAARAGGLQF